MSKVCKSPYGNYYVLRNEKFDIDQFDKIPSSQIIKNIIQGWFEYHGTDKVYDLDKIAIDLLNGCKIEMRFGGSNMKGIVTDSLVYFD